MKVCIATPSFPVTPPPPLSMTLLLLLTCAFLGLYTHRSVSSLWSFFPGLSYGYSEVFTLWDVLKCPLLVSLEWFLIQSVAMDVLVKSSYGRRVIHVPGSRTADPMLDAHLT